jgi:hypothetical protein
MYWLVSVLQVHEVWCGRNADGCGKRGSMFFYRDCMNQGCCVYRICSSLSCLYKCSCLSTELCSSDGFCSEQQCASLPQSGEGKSIASLHLVPLGSSTSPRRDQPRMRIFCYLGKPCSWFCHDGLVFDIDNRFEHQILLEFYPPVQDDSQFVPHDWELVVYMKK